MKVTCFKCGKSGHYANECASSKKVCYECNEKGHISINCPKKKEPAKSKAFHMILDEADVNTRNQG